MSSNKNSGNKRGQVTTSGNAIFCRALCTMAVAYALSGLGGCAAGPGESAKNLIDYLNLRNSFNASLN